MATTCCLCHHSDHFLGHTCMASPPTRKGLNLTPCSPLCPPLPVPRTHIAPPRMETARRDTPPLPPQRPITPSTRLHCFHPRPPRVNLTPRRLCHPDTPHLPCPYPHGLLAWNNTTPDTQPLPPQRPLPWPHTCSASPPTVEDGMQKSTPSCGPLCPP